MEISYLKKTCSKDNVRLDAYLADIGAYKSRSQATKFLDKITVNGKSVNKNYKLKSGDIIDFEPAPEEVFGPEKIPLDIRYEDDDIIVISKQAGLVCHPSTGHETHTLVNALLYHCGELPDLQGDKTRAGIVHRLDGDTSGLLVAAKTMQAGEKLMADMKEHKPNRHYLALVHGVVKPDTGKIDAPLLRSVKGRPKMIVRDDAAAKDAITTFKVIERYNDTTLLDCKLHTGRTHQIRAHMEFIGHPVVGDPLYSSFKDDIKRQFLHCYVLGFNHPITGEYMEFKDELPQDLKEIL
ncbi:MAG: RluA family pseudouridine synthase [Coriobacteriia bacterium]|nr:RluA family pseudouridine synthase [Coriobacteriia bacterium]